MQEPQLTAVAGGYGYASTTASDHPQRILRNKHRLVPVLDKNAFRWLTALLATNWEIFDGSDIFTHSSSSITFYKHEGLATPVETE